MGKRRARRSRKSNGKRRRRWKDEGMRKERESLNGDLLHMQHSVHHGKLCTVSLNGSTRSNYTNTHTHTRAHTHTHTQA